MSRRLLAAPAGMPDSFTQRTTGSPRARSKVSTRAARAFFSLPEPEKLAIRDEPRRASVARVFSGRRRADIGKARRTELGPDDPRVLRGVPLHGANLFPARPKELRAAVLEYMDAATRAAHAILEGIALSLGLESRYFRQHYTGDPTILFRIFHYPSAGKGNDVGASASTPTTAC